MLNAGGAEGVRASVIDAITAGGKMNAPVVLLTCYCLLKALRSEHAKM